MPVTDSSIHSKSNINMYKIDYINNKKILTSNLITSAGAFFTTRESVVTPNVMKEITQKCEENLKDIALFLRIDVTDIISPIQTHSSNISVAEKGKTYENTDALVTDCPDIALLLNFADCTPVILYDEKRNIGAIAHAGWRGTAASIVPKTIKFMKNNFNSSPCDMKALIGPSISLKNYQVGEEVYRKVSKTMEKKYNDYFFFDTNTEKYNLDLKTVNFHQLVEAGLDKKRIDKCNYCTYDSNDIFFSYRKENGYTARHSAILKLDNTKN